MCHYSTVEQYTIHTVTNSVVSSAEAVICDADLLSFLTHIPK
jgi:hypothetical protein